MAVRLEKCCTAAVQITTLFPIICEQYILMAFAVYSVLREYFTVVYFQFMQILKPGSF